MRLDLYLVENNFFKTRNKAKQAIDDKAIYVDDKLITKASFDVLPDSKVEIRGEICPFVSRGGYKLLRSEERR